MSLGELLGLLQPLRVRALVGGLLASRGVLAARGLLLARGVLTA